MARRTPAVSRPYFRTGTSPMYAVIKTGGKQYRVAKNEVLVVERLEGEPGGTIEFGEVLMVGGESPVLGAPTVAGAKVTATVLEQGKGEKVIIFKKKRRKHYRRRNGHRQLQTVVRIADIVTA
jgi:large subunit ribosomal protein L21